MTEHGAIHWSECISSDVEATKDFFQNVVGWKINEMPMPNGVYNVCMVADRPVAGIMSVDMIDADHDIQPHWMTYIAVSDVDAAAAATTTNGGTVINPPFDVPGVGRIAIIQDPGGSICGIMTPATPD